MIRIHSAPSPFCPVGRNISGVLDQTYATLRENLIDSMKSVTMDAIVKDYHAALAAEKQHTRGQQE